MTRVEKIEREIEKLSPEERRKLRNWILELDAETWDKEIEAEKCMTSPSPEAPPMIPDGLASRHLGWNVERSAATEADERRLVGGLALAALVAAVGTSCLVGPAWMVDYGFETAASRTDALGEIPVSTSPIDGDVDLPASDEHVEFGFRVEPGRILLSVENRGPGSLP